jgi:hypothetical protein
LEVLRFNRHFLMAVIGFQPQHAMGILMLVQKKCEAAMGSHSLMGHLLLVLLAVYFRYFMPSTLTCNKIKSKTNILEASSA